MIGVILWSDRARESAIIWCEDHAALAYLRGRENLIIEDQWPEVGDLVELESEYVAEHRLARRVSLMSPRQRPDLPGLLREMETSPPGKPALRVVSGGEGRKKPLPLPLKVAAAG
ncbi:hypothetical protein [Paracoccus ravus]|uniref:hypothetical protein n=1 Tax=Paracoccus ravus TaxID=2447760 RepID=UPI00106DFCC0|nr:hypothetical protein [Paracoccus ravus]